ncbi:MAG: PAS domain S-box protein [Desulfobacterales bacterium]|jgi:PAS domain S-box-containing protein|nr:PAS domain S-box protein [Desulfobacterales bacterium]
MNDQFSDEKIARRIEALRAEKDTVLNAYNDLKASERMYRLILESISDAVVLTDAGGNITYASPNTTTVIGLSCEQVSASGTIYCLLNADVRDIPALKGKGDVVHREWVISEKSGHQRVLSIRIHPVESKPGSALYVMRDITGTVRSEHVEIALRESETRFRMVVENSWDGIHQLDLRTGRYIFMSPSRERLSGFRSEEQIRSMTEFERRLHPEDRIAFGTYLAGIIAGEVIEKTIEYRWQVKSGAYRWFSDSRRAVFDENGKAVALIGVSRDITESKNIQAALEVSKRELEKTVAERTAELELRNRQLHELSRHTISAMENDRKALSKEIHDSIGGSLSAIKMMLETRLHEHFKLLLPDEEITSLEQIIGYLADTIKESKRISHQMRSLALDDFGLTAAISENIKNFKQFYTDIAVDFQINVSREDIPDEITTVIYRIVQEALNNVGKHSSAGKVRIELAESDNRLSLKVEDDGCGFDVLQALDLDQTMSGFGLRSMKERVEICNGEFRVTSEPGKGTILFASIPNGPLNSGRSAFSAAGRVQGAKT